MRSLSEYSRLSELNNCLHGRAIHKEITHFRLQFDQVVHLYYKNFHLICVIMAETSEELMALHQPTCCPQSTELAALLGVVSLENVLPHITILMTDSLTSVSNQPER